MRCRALSARSSFFSSGSSKAVSIDRSRPCASSTPLHKAAYAIINQLFKACSPCAYNYFSAGHGLQAGVREIIYPGGQHDGAGMLDNGQKLCMRQNPGVNNFIMQGPSLRADIINHCAVIEPHVLPYKDKKKFRIFLKQRQYTITNCFTSATLLNRKTKDTFFLRRWQHRVCHSFVRWCGYKGFPPDGLFSWVSFSTCSATVLPGPMSLSVFFIATASKRLCKFSVQSGPIAVAASTATEGLICEQLKEWPAA